MKHSKTNKHLKASTGVAFDTKPFSELQSVICGRGSDKQ